MKWGSWWILMAGLLACGPAVAQAGIADDVRKTLERGGNPNGWIKQEFGFRTHPLHMVAAADTSEKDRLEAIRLLLKAGAEVNGRDDLGNTPLHEAISALNLKAARLLLDSGADVNARNQSGQTPLHGLDAAASALNNKRVSAREQRALTRQMAVAVVLLRHHGARLEVRDEDGRTPLNLLAENAPGKVIEDLLLAGARVDVRDAKGETPLERAVKWNHDPEAARALLRHGAKADAKLLQYAIENDRFDQALALIHSGMNVDAAGTAGDTPLMTAVTRAVAYRGEIEPRLKVIRALLDAGADPKAKNRLGATPLEMAHEDRRVLAVFQEMGASAAPSRDQMRKQARQRARKPTGKPARGPKSRKSDEAKSPMEIGANQAIARLGELMEQADSMEDAAVKAAAIKTLPDTGAIPGRIRTLERFARASRQVADFLRHGDEYAWQQAKDAGGGREEADAAAQVFRKSVNSVPGIGAAVDRAQANAEWASLTVRAYRLLQQNPGKWRFGRKGEKRLVVTDRDFARRLGDLSRRMKDAGRRADEAIDRFHAAKAAGK